LSRDAGLLFDRGALPLAVPPLAPQRAGGVRQAATTGRRKPPLQQLLKVVDAPLGVRRKPRGAMLAGRSAGKHPEHKVMARNIAGAAFDLAAATLSVGGNEVKGP